VAEQSKVILHFQGHVFGCCGHGFESYLQAIFAEIPGTDKSI